MRHHRQATWTRRSSLARPLALLAGVGTIAVAAAGLVAPSAGAVAPRALPSTNLAYTPLPSPTRLADTRPGATDPSTYAGMTLSGGSALTVDIPSSAGVPADAGAVVVDISAIQPSSDGFLSVYPGGAQNPGTANVNFVAGQTVGNLVTVGLGPDSSSGATQSFTVYEGPSNAGTVDFTADLEGSYAPQTSTSGGAYVGLTPTRAWDSRPGSGEPGAGTTLSSGAESDNVPVAGTAGVPANASAVVLNVALTDASAGSSGAPNFVYAYPTGSPPSTPVAAQTYVAGETLSTQVIVGVGSGGDVTVANHTGSLDVIVDISGYFTPAGGSGALFTALSSPQRLVDTRPSTLAGGTVGTFNLPQSTASAGVLNVVDIYEASTGGNFLTVYPGGQNPPTAATVNYSTGDTNTVVPNATYATTGPSEAVSIYNGPPSAGPAAVVVDEFGYFTGASNGVTVTVSANPSTVPADGATQSTITVTVTQGGNPVSGDPIQLNGSGSPAGACGTVNATTGTTDLSGTATFTYTASTTAGTCTITATEADSDQSGSTSITQSSSPTNTVTVTASPSSVTANGSATSSVTVTVKDSSGNPVSGDDVTLTTSAYPTGACGSLNHTSGTTTSSGQVAATYTASSTSGFCTITASESQTGASGSTTITQTSSSPSIMPNSVTVTASPSSVSASGSATSTITATVKNFLGQAVSGDPVMFTMSASPAGSCGMLSSTTGTTNSSGVVSVTYTSSTVPGTCTITATEANTAASGKGTVTQTSSDAVTVTASPQSVPADGAATSTVTVTVTTPTGSPMSGDSVTLTDSPSPSGSCGMLSPTSGTTNASGQITATYTASTTTGFCTITATESATSGSGSTKITQTKPGASSVTVQANPSSLQANGSSTSTVTITVDDSGGVGFAGDPVSISASGSNGGATVCTDSNLSTTSGTTDTNGQVTVTYTASTTGGTCTITATEASAGLTGVGTITQTTNNSVTVSPSPASVPADGAANASTVTITVTGPTGSPVSGDSVSLSTSGAPTGSCGVLSSPSGTTNSSGQVTVTYTASLTSGFCTITATESATHQSGSGTVTQTTSPAPANSPYAVTVSASPSSLNTDGTSTSTVTVTVKDSKGNVVSGDPVMLSSAGSPAAACGKLSSTSGTTNASGQVVVTYTSGTTAGTCTISATEANTDSSSGASSATITETPMNHVAVGANPMDLHGAGPTTSTITVTVTSPTGSPVSGDSVTLSTGSANPTGACGMLSSTTGVTDSSGQVSVTYTAPSPYVVGFCTITATEAGTGQHGSVTIDQQS